MCIRDRYLLHVFSSAQSTGQWSLQCLRLCTDYHYKPNFPPPCYSSYRWSCCWCSWCSTWTTGFALKADGVPDLPDVPVKNFEDKSDKIYIDLARRAVSTGNIPLQQEYDLKSPIMFWKNINQLLQSWADHHVAVSYTHLTLPTIYSV